jgi:hypothetical protein
MAISLLPISGIGYDKLSIDYVDHYRNGKAQMIPIQQVATEAQLLTLLTAIDACTQANLCEVTRAGTIYDINGQEASNDGAFSSCYDRVMLDYVSVDRCKSSVAIGIPAPMPALFTGQSKQIVDPNSTLLVALNAALEPILINPKDGKTDLKFNIGHRVADALPTVTVF